jgi:hypothetical protein
MTLKTDDNVTVSADHLPVSSADVSSAWSHTFAHGMHSWRGAE